MALSANTVFEVRTTGADTNGGGFVTGASGTDWSQQNAAQYSVTDAVTAGTTTITSATASFGTDVVGNILYITGGTGAIVGAWYEIVSRTNATTIVVDRATGLTAGTGATLKIGGCFLTIATALAQMSVSGIQTYVKAGTYIITSALTVPAGPSYGTLTRLIGYNATRNDATIKGTRPIISVTAAVNGVNHAQAGFTIENFVLDGTSTGLIGINGTGGGFSNKLFNVAAHHFTAEGIKTAFDGDVISHCEVYNCGGTGGFANNGSTYYFCHSHNNTTHGFSTGAGAMFYSCVSANNTGATTDGYICTNYDLSFFNCVADTNGRHGFNLNSNYIMNGIFGNISVNNAGYGLITPMSPVRNDTSVGYNAYFGNTLGARNNNNAGTGDVTLTGSPFTNTATFDYSLNSTAGAGAALKSVGFAGVSLIGTGYADIGPLRHQDPAGGGGGLLTHPGMGGGMRA